MDLSSLKARVDDLVFQAGQENLEESIEHTNMLFQGTLTVLSAVHGPKSLQVTALQEAASEANRKSTRLQSNITDLNRAVRGTLKNLKAELDTGLAGSLQKRLTGEVLTDLVQLARTVLDNPGDDAKNVASVLAAAAYEDTIRRMGSSFAGMMGERDLSDVIEGLKNKGVLVSPQLGIAQSFLNFRNRALHANWDQIDRAAVNSVLGFVQELLLKHFQ